MLKRKLNLLYQSNNKITLNKNENNSWIRFLDSQYECYAYWFLELIYHKVLTMALVMDNLTINN